MKANFIQRLREIVDREKARYSDGSLVGSTPVANLGLRYEDAACSAIEMHEAFLAGDYVDITNWINPGDRIIK